MLRRVGRPHPRRLALHHVAQPEPRAVHDPAARPDRGAERIPHEVVDIDVLEVRIIERADLLKPRRPELVRTEHPAALDALERVLLAPQRLADPQPVDVAALEDVLELKFDVHLLLLGVHHHPQRIDVLLPALRPGQVQQLGPLRDGLRDAILDLPVGQRDVKVRAPMLLRVVEHAVTVVRPGGRPGVTELPEASVLLIAAVAHLPPVGADATLEGLDVRADPVEDVALLRRRLVPRACGVLRDDTGGH
jgi:hypothetical protein